MPDEPLQPKYPKPKILLIDMPQECTKALRDAGYNVSVGTFGVPYAVERSDELYFVSGETCTLPNCEEQEIVIANTARPSPQAEPPEEDPGTGVKAVWQRASNGAIDPRPLAMANARSSFGRILNNGGIFVVFLSARYRVEYVLGERGYHGVRESKSFTWTSWSFLSVLESFEDARRSGVEIEFDPKIRGFTDLLKRGSAGARYRCALAPDYEYRERWKSIAKNKYGDDVAGCVFFEKPAGCALFLPQMPSVHTILVRLVEDFCAQLNPRLFPDHEGSRWLRRPEYEIPEVNRLREQIEATRKAADEEVSRLEGQIAAVRGRNSDWYTLLKGTGDELVGTVIRSLRKVGFEQVVDVDEQARQAGEDRSLREDIQIRDDSPVLIVDVKGVTGHPEDAEATQSEKHALMRAKEFGGDVKALTIINHQRNLPPHDRDQQAYRQEIIDNAEQTRLGLMTTWDLFRLLRNMDILGWSAEVVKSVFYRTGRIEPVPQHYVQLGAIVHVWQSAFGIIPSQPVAKGSKLAVEAGDFFEEMMAESIQVDDASVEEAPAGSNCGVACQDAASRLRKGMRVFLVREQ